MLSAGVHLHVPPIISRESSHLAEIQKITKGDEYQKIGSLKATLEAAYLNGELCFCWLNKLNMGVSPYFSSFESLSNGCSKNYEGITGTIGKSSLLFLFKGSSEKTTLIK